MGGVENREITNRQGTCDPNHAIIPDPTLAHPTVLGSHLRQGS